MNTLRRLKEKKGLTLLEALVALACASFALVSFIALTVSCIEMEDHARRLTEATIIAENMMKEIETNDYPEIGDEEGEVAGKEGFLFKKHVEESFIEGVREVRLEILWDGGKRKTEFLCYRRSK